MKSLPTRVVTCRCGSVKIKVKGLPLMVNTCHCKYCQEGSAKIELLPNAPHITDPCGGTAYVLFRKDRVKIVQGSDLLTDYRLDGEKDTRRAVSSCCHSPVFLDFAPGHWVSIYQQRFNTPVPQVERRIQINSMPAGKCPDDGLPAHGGFPPIMMAKLLGARVAMGFKPNMSMR